MAHAGTAHGMSEIITFGEKDPEATLPASGPINERDSLKHCDLMQQQQRQF